MTSEAEEDEAKHYHGHRERLRARLREAGPTALADYELLELVLFRAIPQRDVKPLAKALLAAVRLVRGGDRGGAASSWPRSKAWARPRSRSSRSSKPPRNGSPKARSRNGCRWAHGAKSSTIAARRWRSRTARIFRILFLDKKNGLIADEVQGTGTVDHTPVYPREVVRRALELSATAIVLVHNHPSGDPSPSTQDVKMTLDIMEIAKALGVTVHDHIIIGRNGHASLKGLQLM